jgi:hypothetical protein
MSAADEREREQQALEALIVAAFRQEDFEVQDLPDVTTPGPILAEEDRRALDALGPDLVARIVAGTWAPRSRRAPGKHPGARRAEPELAGAMHRGDDEGEITDAAREEMERRVRELEAEDEEGPQA